MMDTHLLLLITDISKSAIYQCVTVTIVIDDPVTDTPDPDIGRHLLLRKANIIVPLDLKLLVIKDLSIEIHILLLVPIYVGRLIVAIIKRKIDPVRLRLTLESLQRYREWCEDYEIIEPTKYQPTKVTNY